MFKYLKLTIMFTALIAIISCGKTDGTKTLATVDGKDISQLEFDSYLKFKRLSGADKNHQEKLLDQYLENEAVADVIEKQPLLDKEMIKVELNEFRKEMLISRYFEAFLKDKVNDQQVENYYNTHAGEFETRKVHVAHILIRTNAKMGELERKAKLTKAQEVYSKLRAGGNFNKLAEQYSEDKNTAKKGGDLGWITEGGIDSRFSKQAFSMKAGDISEPFETSYGFHVIKVLDGPKTVKQPLSAIKGNIRHRLRNQAKQAEMERLLKLTKIEKK